MTSNVAITKKKKNMSDINTRMNQLQNEPVQHVPVVKATFVDDCK